MAREMDAHAVSVLLKMPLECGGKIMGSLGLRKPALKLKGAINATKEKGESKIP